VSIWSPALDHPSAPRGYPERSLGTPGDWTAHSLHLRRGTPPPPSRLAVRWEYMDSWPDGEKEQVPVRGSLTDPERAASLFEQSAAIMARLRAPGGCPWDREQTFDTIRKYTLEEAYEVFDAIEQRDFPHLAEELGDLLLQVLFYAEMAANEGHFTISDVLDHLNRKLIRRHPHVFGEEASRAAGNVADVDADVAESAAVLRNWEEIKAQEKRPGGGVDSLAVESRLDSVPRAMPALAEAAKLGSKAAKAGFDWATWRDLLPKVAEELAELQVEAAAGRKAEMDAELGDLLFTVVNLGRHLGVDAEMALRGCNLRFRRRFREMEIASSKPLEELAPPELDQLWSAAKLLLGKESEDHTSGVEAHKSGLVHGAGAEAPLYHPKTPAGGSDPEGRA
jgi:MazG family protein